MSLVVTPRVRLDDMLPFRENADAAPARSEQSRLRQVRGRGARSPLGCSLHWAAFFACRIFNFVVFLGAINGCCAYKDAHMRLEICVSPGRGVRTIIRLGLSIVLLARCVRSTSEYGLFLFHPR